MYSFNIQKKTPGFRRSYLLFWLCEPYNYTFTVITLTFLPANRLAASRFPSLSSKNTNVSYPALMRWSIICAFFSWMLPSRPSCGSLTANMSSVLILIPFLRRNFFMFYCIYLSYFLRPLTSFTTLRSSGLLKLII